MLKYSVTGAFPFDCPKGGQAEVSDMSWGIILM